MKFQPEEFDGVNVVTRHERARIWVGATAHDASVLVPWTGAVVPWGAAALADLTPAHFERIAELAPEVVIFGSGSRLVFPPPALLLPLIARRIGFETMDTAAACRTYNVLVSERRSALAALLIGPAA